MIYWIKPKYLVGLVLLLTIIFMAGCAASHGNSDEQNEPILPATERLSTKTSEGIVTVELTPEKSEKGLLIVEYILNTHSVDMSQIDLQSQTVLEFGGNQYTPVNKPVLSGHHNSGELQFKIPAILRREY